MPAQTGPDGPDLRGFGLDDDDLRALGYTVGGRRADDPGEGPPGGSDDGREGRVQVRIRFGPAALRWIGAVALYAAAAWYGMPERHLPAPMPAAAPDTTFSAARAMTHVVDVGRSRRQIGSPEHERVRAYVRGRLELLGIESEVQVTQVAGPSNEGVVRSATVRNVIARIPAADVSGPDGARPIVLTAPYDGPGLSPAAGRATGVAAVLEALRVLTAGPPLSTDVVAVFADAGTVDQVGLRAALRSHPWTQDPRAVLTVDAFGATGPVFALGPGSNDPVVRHALAGSMNVPGSPLLADALSTMASAATRPEDGPPALTGETLHFVALGDVANDGQPYDTPGRVSERTLQHAGSQLLAVVRTLDSSDPGGDAAADVASFWLPIVGAVLVPRDRLAFAALVPLLLLGLLFGLLRLRSGGWRGVAVGASLALVLVGVVAGLGGWMLDLIGPLHDEFGSLRGAFYRDGRHQLALVALGVAVAATLHAIARRRIRRDELCSGALILPVLVGLWVSWSAPGAALSFHLPLVLGLLAVVLVTAAGRARAAGWLVAPVVVLLQALTLFLIVPAVATSARLWTLAHPGQLGALIGLALIPLLPSLEILARPRAWVVPVLGLLGAVLLIGSAVPRGRADEAHPIPSTLVWFTDQLAESRISALIPGAVAADSTGRRRMAGRWLSRPGAGTDWARSWVAEPPAGPVPLDGLLLPRQDEYRVIGSGPDAELLAPTLTLVRRAEEGDRTVVEVDLRSGLGGEMTALHIDPARGRISSVGALRLGSAPPVTTLSHWGVPVGGAVRLGLSLPAGTDSVAVTVVEHHLRPREVLGVFFYERADSLIPDVSAGSDRVVQRTVVPLLVAADGAGDAEVGEGAEASGRAPASQRPQRR